MVKEEEEEMEEGGGNEVPDVATQPSEIVFMNGDMRRRLQGQGQE